jgi:hypothetical protein
MVGKGLNNVDTLQFKSLPGGQIKITVLHRVQYHGKARCHRNMPDEISFGFPWSLCKYRKDRLMRSQSLSIVHL